MKVFHIASSMIHGKGVFSSRPIKANEIIGLMCTFRHNYDLNITQNFGKYVNHSFAPNVELMKLGTKYYLRAKQDINKDKELVVNYDKNPAFLKKYKSVEEKIKRGRN